MNPPYFRMFSATSSGLKMIDGVEVREEHDADDVQQVVERHAVGDLIDHRPSAQLPASNSGAAIVGERQDGRGEDHRDHAAGVHLQRDVRARPAGTDAGRRRVWRTAR